MSDTSLQIKSLQCIEAAYNEAHELLTQLGIGEPGLSVTDRLKLLAKREATLRLASRKALVIVGAAAASSPNTMRPMRTKIYNDLVLALER